MHISRIYISSGALSEKNMSFELDENFLQIKGEPKSGKSTLIKSIHGLYEKFCKNVIMELNTKFSIPANEMELEISGWEFFQDQPLQILLSYNLPAFNSGSKADIEVCFTHEGYSVKKGQEIIDAIRVTQTNRHVPVIHYIDASLLPSNDVAHPLPDRKNIIAYFEKLFHQYTGIHYIRTPEEDMVLGKFTAKFHRDNSEILYSYKDLSRTEKSLFRLFAFVLYFFRGGDILLVDDMDVSFPKKDIESILASLHDLIQLNDGQLVITLIENFLNRYIATSKNVVIDKSNSTVSNEVRFN